MPPQKPTPSPPPPQPPRPDAGGYYQQVSAADPMANQSAQQTTQQTGKFDFMLNEQTKPKRSFGLPGNLGKPVKLLILGGGVLVIIILLVSIFGGGKDSTTQALDLMAQNQEIIRISRLQDRHLRDANVLNLSATTQAIMTSQQADFATYLTKIKAKYKVAQVSARANPNTDVQLEAAANNDNLDSTYVLYVKKSLAVYQKSLKETYDITSSRSLKKDLQDAYTSVSILLKSPQFTVDSDT